MAGRHIHKFTAAFTEAGFRPIGHLIFPKPYTSGARFLRYRHECAYLLAKGEPKQPDHPIADVIPWRHYTGNKLHPSQKPLNVPLPLIKAFCPPHGTVLDPFAGSGSSLIAARQLGRQCVGIEIDKRHCRTATMRLAEATTFNRLVA